MKPPAGIRIIQGQVGQSWKRFGSRLPPRGFVGSASTGGTLAAVTTGAGAVGGFSVGFEAGGSTAGRTRRCRRSLRRFRPTGDLRLCCRGRAVQLRGAPLRLFRVAGCREKAQESLDLRRVAAVSHVLPQSGLHPGIGSTRCRPDLDINRTFSRSAVPIID